MSNHPIVVVDASVATKWQLRDEEMIAEADTVLAAYYQDEIALVAPGCIRYEVSGSIRKSLRTKRLTDAAARQAISAFLNVGIPLIDDGDLVLDAFDLSVQIGCSFYDAMYLALANTMNCAFVHADSRLANTLGGQFALEVWLTDWPSWLAKSR